MSYTHGRLHSKVEYHRFFEQCSGERVLGHRNPSHGIGPGGQCFAGRSGRRPVPHGSFVGPGTADIPAARWPLHNPAMRHRGPREQRWGGDSGGVQLRLSLNQSAAGLAQLPSLAVNRTTLLARHESVSPALSQLKNDPRPFRRDYRPDMVGIGRRKMPSRRCCSLVVLAWFVSSPAWSSLAWGQSARPQRAAQNGGDFSNNVQPANKVPAGVILVKGAWSSASDSVTPLPEGGSVTNNVFSNQHF